MKSSLQNCAQGRIEWIDVYKGIAILLILVHHVTQYFPLLKSITGFVKLFHVSMFFLISGWTIRIKGKRQINITKQIWGKIKHLMIPYVFFSFLSSVIKIAVLLVTGKFYSEIVWEEIYEILTLGNGPVWYLNAMFFVSILFCILQVYILQNDVINKKFPYEGVILGLFLVLVYFMQDIESNQIILLIIRRTVLGLIEVLIGYYSCQLLEVKDRNKKIILAISLLLLGIVLYCLFTPTLSFKNGSSNNYWIAIIDCNLISIGLLLLIQFFVDISKNNYVYKILKFYGMDSLIVLVVHPIFLNVFSYTMANNVRNMDLVGQIVLAAIVFSYLMLTSMIMIRFFNKHFRILVGKDWSPCKM